jgi:hypothetical protein
MKYPILAVLICCYSICFSQYVEPEPDEQLKKNAIGVGINPFVAVALGAGSEGLHFGFQYKRVVAENKRLRFGAFFQQGDNVNKPGQPIGMTDSSFFAEFSYDRYNTYEFRGGVEWSDFKAKNDGFFGVDLIAGLDKITEFNAVNEYVLATNEGGSLYGSDLSADTSRFYTDSYFTVGLAPFFGYRVEFKEHWELSAWMSPEFVYAMPVKTDTHGVQQIHHANSYISFRMRLLDIVFAYRF